MSLDEITVTIIGFIKDELLEEKGVVLSPASELIDSGLLNSMSVIRLLAFLQDHYQIEDISNNDMHLENFRTISTIADLVGRYINAK
jgi:acyl carrier protein